MGKKQELGANFERALQYTTRAHASQKRKGSGVSYIGHLLGVAGIVIDAGAGEDTVVAALLHDTVEDQGGKKRLKDIEAKFGRRVAAIVAACSDTDVQPKPPWRQRKENYLLHLEAERDPDILLVSTADKLYNIRAINLDRLLVGDQLWKQFNAAREEQLWYYSTLSKVLRRNPKAPSQLVFEFAREVRRLRQLARGRAR